MKYIVAKSGETGGDRGGGRAQFTELHSDYSLRCALRTAHCAFEFQQNGRKFLIH
jgi:hypothetical protein